LLEVKEVNRVANCQVCAEDVAVTSTNTL